MAPKNGTVSVRINKRTTDVEIKIEDPNGVYAYRVYQIRRQGRLEAHQNYPDDEDNCPTTEIVKLGGPGHDTHKHHVIYWDCQEGGAARETWRVPAPEADGSWTEGRRLSSKDLRVAADESGGSRLQTVLFVAILLVLFVLWRRRGSERSDETP